MAREHSKRFPLWFHTGTGQWGKKRLGKYYYFGSDKPSALQRYLAEWPDILAGRAPRPASDGCTTTVRDAVNHFLTTKQAALDEGIISAPMWHHYTRAATLVIEAFGRERHVADLRPDDFAALRGKLAKYGPSTVTGIITRVRTIFKHAFDYELIDKPVRFGPGFAKPKQKELRLAKKSKMLAPAQIRRLIDKADVPLKAMILLGINCGYGQSDCSELPLAALNEKGWIVFPRPKTGIARRCPLWPETAKAIKDSIAVRPIPAEDDRHLVFVTRFGRRFLRYTAGTAAKPGHRTDGIGQEYGKLAKALKVPTGFYRLRHCHRTAADAVKDQVAAGVIMGHVDSSMAGNYRETVDDERLKAISIAVRKWLMKTE